MKAHHLLFEKLIDINPRTGTIMFDDRRMALVSVEALGILRRDLVNTLSMDRAKGFLMRYGWACGFKDGETIEKMYDWGSRQELLLAGPYLHTLEGVVTVEPDTIDFCEQKLHFTGFWKNSFEAVEHINHYGLSKDPVCWILIGYASGYLTKTFGKEVLVYEEKCEGKGDSHCYFVAKTVDHNDERHQQYLRYYKSETLLSELDRAYKEIQELNENIIESEKVQNRLTDMLLEDKDVSDTVSLISDTLQKSIVIDYINETLERSFICQEDEATYRDWKKDNELTGGTEKHIQTFPIKAHKAILGRMVVISEGPMNKKEQMIIKRALMVCTVQMFHQRKLMNSVWQKKEDLFDELLRNKYDEDTLHRHMYMFDFNPQAINRILTLKVDPVSNKKDILQYLSIVYSGIDLFIKDDYIILILSDQNSLEVQPFSLQLQKNLQEKFKSMKAFIGVGRPANDLKTLGKSYHDACRICDFIQLAYPTDSRTSYFEELEPIIMFLKGADQEELIDFCKNTIGKLVEYDVANQGNLVITLKSYLDYNGNLQQTADDLHMSIAGLRYRLEKIESLCNADLKTGTGRFKYQLAVRIYFGMQIIDERYSFAT
jgi:PucR family transcriptional regulator, purine catabolism regulatory protein